MVCAHNPFVLPPIDAGCGGTPVASDLQRGADVTPQTLLATTQIFALVNPVFIDAFIILDVEEPLTLAGKVHE